MTTKLNVRHLTVERLQKYISNFWKADAFDHLTCEECFGIADDWRDIADAILVQDGDLLRHSLAMALVDIFEAKARKLMGGDDGQN